MASTTEGPPSSSSPPRGGGPAPWPPRLDWTAIRDGYQRDLERRAAFVAGQVRQWSRSGAGWAGPRWRGFTIPVWRRRTVRLADGERSIVHDVSGPRGAPTVVLLHGWGGTAVANWAVSMGTLARDFRVVAPDLRGHDLAAVDDVAAIADALDVERFIAVGYSLGSAVASQLWRRHPGRVDGLVLCAAAGVAVPPSEVPVVPTAVVVTRQDRIVPAASQLQLARQFPGATVHPVDGTHFAFARYGSFVPVLLDACRSVAGRAGERDAAG